MGAQDVRAPRDAAEARTVTRAVLADVAALERMWEEDRFERGVRRVGAEQELFVVDGRGRPAPRALELLQRIDRPQFTTELARFNLEANLDPLPLDGRFLSAMERDLNAAVDRARMAALDLGLDVAMIGILPSLESADLTLENMTPQPRYAAMNDVLCAQRGADFSVYIRGVDVLETTVDNVMMESANTSFQLHLQVDKSTFAPTYNLIQAVTAPLLAAAVNSPTLLGQRLWQETRIALFERATDGRDVGQRSRATPPRVTFGSQWVDQSPIEIFREDVARHRVMLMREGGEDPLAVLDRGELPTLGALALFNGTVWRWNRPCFGVHNGVAHLRIENRVLPSGPTPADTMANAALFYGAVLGLERQVKDVRERMPFRAAHQNFLAAARSGLSAQFEWFDGRRVTARDLLLDELIPLAWVALLGQGVPEAVIERTLGVVRDRAQTGQTGAQWLMSGLDALREVPRSRRARALTLGQVHRASTGQPVHLWTPMTAEEGADVAATEVRDVMTTDLFTVGPEDVVDLATDVMDWKHIRHVPVEEDGRVVGLLTHHALLHASSATPTPVRAHMVSDVERVPPDLPLDQAVRRLLASSHGALLVVDEDGMLIGLATDRDLLIGMS